MNPKSGLYCAASFKKPLLARINNHRWVDGTGTMDSFVTLLRALTLNDTSLRHVATHLAASLLPSIRSRTSSIEAANRAQQTQRDITLPYGILPISGGLNPGIIGDAI